MVGASSGGDAGRGVRKAKSQAVGGRKGSTISSMLRFCVCVSERRQWGEAGSRGEDAGEDMKASSRTIIDDGVRHTVEGRGKNERMSGSDAKQQNKTKRTETIPPFDGPSLRRRQHFTFTLHVKYLR